MLLYVAHILFAIFYKVPVLAVIYIIFKLPADEKTHPGESDCVR